MLNIGERIVNMRERLDISQVGLAKAAGLSATTLSKYEKNLREPRAEIIVRIASALHTTTDYLLCQTNNWSPLKKDANWIRVNDEEIYIIGTFRLLSEREKGQIIERLQVLYEQHKE